MSDYAIEATDLVRKFKNGPRAVDGIDLGVAPGEIYGFLGPNGAGKSTTVHMLTTLLPPTSGTARVAGYDVVTEGPQVRAAIGAALQEAALDPLLTGREHLRLQASLQALPRAERNQRANELIARVGLTHAADRKVRGYSGGMKRRLDLAMALVHSPSVLFLDEPTTGLDIQSRTALWDEVARLARKAEVGRPTVEAIPADPDDAVRLADMLARFGDPCGSTKGVAVRLETGETSLADVVRALDDAGIEVANLWLHQPTLDDVFLAKTGRSLEGSDDDEAGPSRRELAAEPV